MRAEILGAFFNAVFLIALCLSIVLEAITRLIDPPTISNAKLILIVGCLGLTSNLVGFFVLGGHGHSHGPEEHSHDNAHSHGSHDDELRAAEEGHSHDHIPGEYSHEDADDEHDNPAYVKAKALIRSPKSVRQQKRRTSRGFSSRDDIPIYPARIREALIESSRQQLDGIESEEGTASEGEAVDDDAAAPTENTPLIASSNGKANETSHDRHSHHSTPSPFPRHDSAHAKHNHNKPKKAAKGGHGHNHADMGMNAMVLHVIGDALGNVGVIVSALVIWLTTSPYRFYADPAVSLFITLIILKSCIPLTAATAKILLQATPDHIDVADIKEDIQDIPGVISCHHIHIWQLSDTQIVASMHIQIAFPISEAGGDKYMALARAARACLHAYGIHSATLQPEFCLDKDHDHFEGTEMGLDGIVGQPRCRMDDDCLLECVDDCAAGGCCAPASAVGSSHSHDDHDGHSH